MEIGKFWVSDYKCYKRPLEVEIDNSNEFSLVIGKNNSGKSVFLKLIRDIYCRKNDNYPNCFCSFFSSFDCNKFVSRLVSRPFILSSDYQQSFERWEIEEVRNSFAAEKIYITVRGNEISFLRKPANISTDLWKRIENVLTTFLEETVVPDFWNSLARYNPICVDSERDIVPEEANNSIKINANGSGATNVVRHFLNESDKPEERIEKEVLRDLNEIMGEDGHFDRIQIKSEIASQPNKAGNGENGAEEKWQIYLSESGSDKRFGLSEVGSGLKTILLILLQLHNYNGPHGNLLFCFEEPENNLHPAIQRRLFDFLYRWSEGKGDRFFITSHSSVPLNLYFGRPHTAIYHVEKIEGQSSCKLLENLSDARCILDDLGISASDILQANGIIWVEGPSDRIYINAWLKLAGSPYKEGVDYSFLYTGGKNLAQLSADDESVTQLIQMLLINRNAVLVSDRDEDSETDKLNVTKQRVICELTRKNFICWVTAGREIENYLSLTTIQKIFPTFTGTLTRYGHFSEAIEPVFPNFSNKKREFAELISSKFDPEDLKALDLESKIQSLLSEIKKWNMSASKVE